jgi:hypothetical protein
MAVVTACRQDRILATTLPPLEPLVHLLVHEDPSPATAARRQRIDGVRHAAVDRCPAEARALRQLGDRDLRHVLRETVACFHAPRIVRDLGATSQRRWGHYAPYVGTLRCGVNLSSHAEVVRMRGLSRATH